MELIRQSAELMFFTPYAEAKIEQAGRVCYKSEHKIDEGTASRFCDGLFKHGHHSVLEHASATARFITNRGVTHELVRHRLASFSQESTRYCNYGTAHVRFILPVWSKLEPGIYKYNTLTQYSSADNLFLQNCMDCERDYKRLLELGWRPEQAREVLPNSLKTEIVMTANLREWMHVFKLRKSPKAHPQIRDLMERLYPEFYLRASTLFPLESEGK